MLMEQSTDCLFIMYTVFFATLAAAGFTRIEARAASTMQLYDAHDHLARSARSFWHLKNRRHEMERLIDDLQRQRPIRATIHDEVIDEPMKQHRRFASPTQWVPCWSYRMLCSYLSKTP
ncbi:hypothetical protein KIN20_032140 [Parelaphostrongylus tenuis]|uniref:Uncharacterized protein n=1 Tax=Parelaphostrongylus tenuis TaxID=148309 RepID=A0AAD5R654_PARTN|nr:hypothetical protein KIN20_032140 [Parelaphostrongylus tenuis]